MISSIIILKFKVHEFFFFFFIINLHNISVILKLVFVNILKINFLNKMYIMYINKKNFFFFY